MSDEKAKRTGRPAGKAATASAGVARPRAGGTSKAVKTGRRSCAGVRKLERRESDKVKRDLKRKENSISAEEAARLAREENVAVGICPFFLQDRGNGRVCCEGASLKFPDKEARREFVYRLCAHPEGYKECRMRIALEHYYERKYEDHE